jgi:hypothetical protein
MTGFDRVYVKYATVIVNGSTHIRWKIITAFSLFVGILRRAGPRQFKPP